MKQINNLLPHLVFVFSSVIILLSSISIIFPALLTILSTNTEITIVEPFELGAFALPLIFCNVIFFIFYLFFRKNIFNLKTILKKVAVFDIPKRIGLILAIIFVSIYAGLSFNEIFLPDDQWVDIDYVMIQYDSWLEHDTFDENVTQLHTKMFLLYLSDFFFNNLRVIPFFASISLLFLTYVFTVKITSKQIAGLISILVLVQSPLFNMFDTTATYTIFWVVLYLLSLYLIEKSWRTSFIPFLLSIFSKPLTILFLPFSIFYILQSSLSTRRKILSLIPYVVIGLSLFIVLFFVFPIFGQYNSTIVIHPSKILSGFAILPYQLRFDLLIMLSLIPLNFLLYRKSLQGDKRASSFQILISGMILSGSVLSGFFNYQINPYRLIPLVVFVAISFGIVVGKFIPRK